MSYYTHLDDFLQSLKDVSRPNLFYVTIEGLSSIEQPDSLVAIKADLPSSTMGEITIKRMGMKVTWPGNTVDWPDATLTFYDDIDGKNRNFFHDWQKWAYTDYREESDKKFQGQSELRYIENTSLTIQQVNGKMSKIGKMILYKVWPKVIGGISLDYSSEDSLNTFDVTFSYSYANNITSSSNFEG